MKTLLPRHAGLRVALASLLAAWLLPAGQTRMWSQNSYADFEKAVRRGVSVRSDGLLTLAPRSVELFDTPSAYLWSLAQDSHGNLYAGGGTGAKLYRIAPDGKGKLFAEFDGLQVQALAIDAKDRVYAATSPDGKVYRVGTNGKAEVFYDPKAKYIWALAFDANGELLVATGDPGAIHRVAPDGKGRPFFQTDETHVRSMALDAQNNVIAGTEPGGLVVRVSPAGEGFVLYQMAKREVTAVAVARDGSIYAAGVGNKQAGGAAPSLPAPPPASTAVAVAAPGAVPAPAAARSAIAPPPSLAPGIAGGSEVYRIEPSGNPRRIWTNAQDVVYAVAFDATGRVLVGAGNRGNVYRIESPVVATTLVAVPSTQITAFQTGRDGKLYAATGNVGKVYAIGPELERQGTVESDVFDAAMYSLWGSLTFDARLNGGGMAIATRSGNLDTPQKNWSPWSSPVASPKGGRVSSPAARFLQWKATVTADSAGRSPELENVDVAYLPKNVEPRLDEIDMTPPNYRFPAPAISPLLAALAPSQTLSLPPMGARNRPAPAAAPADSGTTITPSMTLAKGWVGARWQASDPNGDALLFTVEIRGVNENEWKPLKDKLAEKYFSWDSTAFPDGEYRLRITASDAPGNPPADALTARLESDPFIIDNTPPAISAFTAARSGGKLMVHWHAADALNRIERAEYSLDGGEWTVAAPVSRLSDAPELDYDLALDAAPGEHTVAVRAADEYDNVATAKIVVR
jgi:sugar lactone lactonase YvrE